jgi:hypothetical protein
MYAQRRFELYVPEAYSQCLTLTAVNDGFNYIALSINRWMRVAAWEIHGGTEQFPIESAREIEGDVGELKQLLVELSKDSL